MKKYFTFGLIMSLVSGACFAQHPMIAQLISEKQAKMKKLEDCKGTTKKLKIAGISTLGITAVGVGANIAEAVVLKDAKSKLAESQKAYNEQDCIKNRGGNWVNGECVAKTAKAESAEEAPAEEISEITEEKSAKLTDEKCKEINDQATLNGGKCLYTVNEKIDESKIRATIQDINQNCVKGDWSEGNKFNAKCGEVDFIIDFAGGIKCSANKKFTGGKCDNQKTDTEKADADTAFKNACKTLTGNKEAEEKEANGKKELSCFARNITVAGKDEAIAKAKEKISSCTERADETDEWFAVYCGQGTLEHRTYVKKQAEDPASGVDKEAEKRMANFKSACKAPWRPVSYENGKSVVCVIGDEKTPVSLSEVEKVLKDAYEAGGCTIKNDPREQKDENEHYICCTDGKDDYCNAFVYQYSSLENDTKPAEVETEKKFKDFSDSAEVNKKMTPTGLSSQYFGEAQAICKGAYGIKGELHADGSGYHHCSGITEADCATLDTKDPYIRFVYTDVPGHGTKCWVFHE